MKISKFASSLNSRCCKVCAKIEGEACGGPGGFSGTCEYPLKCITKPPIIGTGVCLGEWNFHVIFRTKVSLT